ncbi:MAG TPA: UbiH/UbiF family hydroxylase [Eoetvoesiella sp.]
MSKDSIVVCGSGIVGLAAALGMTKARLNVTLVGPRQVPEPAQADAYCPRVYAISPSSQRFLTQLGVWNMLDEARITPVEAMEIYGDASGHVTLQAWQAAQPTLAWIVESSELERVLQQAVQVFGISWHTEKLSQIEPPSGAAGSSTVITESGRRLKAELLVGADGARSPVREASGINLKSTPYGDTGLVTHLTSEHFHQNIAMQWFTSDGVLALLPLPDTSDGHQVSMVWSMPRHLADELQALPQAERNAALETRLLHASTGRLGRLQVRSSLHGFPLFLEQSAMVAHGVALVGDAAHRVHPLAGQGLNLGLGDVDELIRVLVNKEAYRHVGDMRVLQRYRRARAEPVLGMRLATDGLHRLFTSQAVPFMFARNLGMQVIDRMPFIKRRLIAGASGD